MQLTVTGKQIDASVVLREYVEASLGTILGKYFKTAIEAHVVLSKEAHLSRAEDSIHIGRGIVVNAGASAAQTYAAFDAAAERIAKQMCRYKRRLRDHHTQAREAFEVGERARDFVLVPHRRRRPAGHETVVTAVPAEAGTHPPAARAVHIWTPAFAGEACTIVRPHELACFFLVSLAEEGEEGPAVVAEMSTEVPNLTVGEAVMRMDLANAPVLLFGNRSHGELNIVYRRLDGNVGWIDPEPDPTRRPHHSQK